MKPLRSFLAAGLALACLSTPALAVTFQVTADTAGSPVTNIIGKTAGTATTLPVSKTSTAFISFDVGNSGINPNAVTAARLVIFFPKVTKVGTLMLFANDKAFTELPTPPATSEPAPGNAGTINSLDVAVADSKNFRTLDVTAQVKSWLNNSGTDFGFGISADSPTSSVSATIGSKEGSGSGYPAVLEVDVNDSGAGNVAGTNATFSGNVSANGSGVFGVDDNAALGADNAVALNPLRLGFLKKSGTGPVIASSSGNPIIFSQSDQNSLLDNIGTSTVTERMRIDSNGNVGIGTTTPGALLEVNGTAQIDSILTVGTTTTVNPLRVKAKPGNFGLSQTDGTTTVGISTSGGDAFIGTSTNSGLGFLIQNGEAMILTKTGNVGIGTTAPNRGKLEVVGNVNRAGTGTSASAFFGGGPYTQGTDAPTSSSLPTSIFADGQICTAASFIAISDARIKNIRGRSDGSADLQTLRSLEITDYCYKDVIAKGIRPQKKVIAQQVEKVFPQAVSQHTDVVPDIYQNAPLHDGWVSLPTDLQVGERVRLIGEKEEGIYEVLEVNETAFRTAFQPATDKVFVYGREVKDFRAVDYDAIAMLNVSATQELARTLEAKEVELKNLRAANATLAEKLTALEARDSAREARLTKLESALDERPARAVTAALDLR